MSKYEAVLFDFDGTLMDTEWTIYEETCVIYANEGQELPLEQYVQCIGSIYDAWSPRTYLEELTGKTFDWDSITEERNKRIRQRLELEGLMAGSKEALECTKSMGLRLGVVSSSSHDWVDDWLEKLQILDFFEAVTCRGDAPRIKPAPDLFLKAAERMNLSPEQCLVVEDSRNGILAARDAGMDVVAVPNRVTIVSDFTEAEIALSCLSEYPNALKNLLAR